MQISTKDWKNYIEKLSKLNNTAGEKMSDYVARHGFDDPKIIDYAYGLVTKYGEGSASLSAMMYDAIAEMEGKILPPAEVANTPGYGEVAKAVNGVRKHSQNPTSYGNVVNRLVKRTGADTMLKNAERDGAEFAWIPSGDTCAFCIALASRGWQHISKKALKNGHAEHIHANCDCNYTVRFDGKSTVAGYNPEEYLEIYESAEGDTPEEKINSIRAKYRAENRDKINAQKRANYELNKKTDNINNIVNLLRKANYNLNKDDIINLQRKYGKSILEELNKYPNVARYNVNKLEKNLSTEEIILKIKGKDNKVGHCTSLALAYIGNKIGFDVKDFRNDPANKVFSHPDTIRNITNLANGKVELDYNDFVATKNLLKNIKNNKEYFLSTGQHSAIVRKAEKGYEYLNLQSDYNYGFKKLNKKVLTDTFFCKEKLISYGLDTLRASFLFDIEELKDNSEFEFLLGYINSR